MGKRAAILLAIVLAMLVRPLQLPAASCILSNAPAAEGCKPNCCANKHCCATSKKDPKPVAPPLHQNDDSKPQQPLALELVAVLDSLLLVAAAEDRPLRSLPLAHSPPPLATTCIRLI